MHRVKCYSDSSKKPHLYINNQADKNALALHKCKDLISWKIFDLSLMHPIYQEILKLYKK